MHVHLHEETTETAAVHVHLHEETTEIATVRAHPHEDTTETMTVRVRPHATTAAMTTVQATRYDVVNASIQEQVSMPIRYAEMVRDAQLLRARVHTAMADQDCWTSYAVHASRVPDRRGIATKTALRHLPRDRATVKLLL